MLRHADIFIDLQAHRDAGRFIQENSTNRNDVRDFTFSCTDLSGCRNILDLGCSYGFFTRGMAGRLHPDARIVGVDLWKGCEEHFVKACRESGYKGEFVLSDDSFCRRFQDQEFDMVLCSYSLYFFPEALPDIARVLKPEGIFIAVTHTVPPMKELVDLIKMLLERQLDRPIPSLPQEELFNVFSSANGKMMLASWFRKINEVPYPNSLHITQESLPNLIKYLCFKKPKFIPAETELDDYFITSVVGDHLREILDREGSLIITKGDTVFTSQYPLAGA